MTLDPTRLLLAFAEPTDPDTAASLLHNFGLILEDARDKGLERQGHPFSGVVNHTTQRFWIRSESGEPIDRELCDTLNNTLEGLDWIGPVYRLGEHSGRGGLVCPLPDTILVKPRPGLAESERKKLDSAIKKFGGKEVRERSKYLNDIRYYQLSKSSEFDAYSIRDALKQESALVSAVYLENMLMIVPLAVVPNDPIFPQQWSMTTIQAGGPGVTGWDISTGLPGVVICILDSGCDLTHPDLAFAPGAAGQGINLGTMMPTGAPVGGANTRGHGTCCAGNAAARYNNATGVTGVAGNCSIMPVAFQNWTDAEVAAGINWAAANGANVISMSFGVYAPGDGFGPTGWNFALIDPAITNAVNVQGCILIAATGNENTGVVNRYPARNPLVIAVGGSDQADNRKSPASADGECWGANFGPDISVVAPCVLNPSTDIQANDGYNSNNGGPILWACVNYPNSGDAAGDYLFMFNGTSSATPHVAGLAGAILSQYPGLSNLEIRDIIERTADKVGGAYAEAAGFTNGTRNNQMGYGRINMFRALDFADTSIRDWPGDNGIEPSSPPGGNFWDFSDIVVRIFDDNVFVPGDPAQSRHLELGQTNYLYVRVTNNGPREARNVEVNARLTTYVGTQFVYPVDWTAVDTTHINPAPVSNTFASIPSGGSVIAKFTISAAQVLKLWNENWHPCMLASVSSDNDYAFATAAFTGSPIVVRRNNLAQRNLSVINVLAGVSAIFPFIIGHPLDDSRFIELVIHRGTLPDDTPLLLALDDENRFFPEVDMENPADTEDDSHDDGMVFLEETRIKTRLGCCDGVLTLARGSRFDCRPKVRIGKVRVRGGETIVRNDRRFVEIREEIAVIRMEKGPRQRFAVALHAEIPTSAGESDAFMVSASQRDESGQVYGGASAIFTVA